jgi:hypothetical protein
MKDQVSPDNLRKFSHLSNVAFFVSDDQFFFDDQKSLYIVW